VGRRGCERDGGEAILEVVSNQLDYAGGSSGDRGNSDDWMASVYWAEKADVNQSHF